MSSLTVTFLADFKQCDARMRQYLMHGIAVSGAKHLVLSSSLITEIMRDYKLAKQHGLSLSTFRREWNRHKEETPGQMVLRLRNRTALDLLRNRRLRIGEVAEMTGYPDVRYFSRFFRRMNRMTPTEYCKRIFDEAAEKPVSPVC